MSNSEGLFWPLDPLCKSDPYVPKKETTRDIPKGIPGFATAKGIPSPPRFINEGQSYIELNKLELQWEKEKKNQRIQASAFLTKPTSKKACPGDYNGTFSRSSYIYDGEPFDWGPKTRVTPSNHKQILACAPAKARDVQVPYVSDAYDAPKIADKVV